MKKFTLPLALLLCSVISIGQERETLSNKDFTQLDVQGNFEVLIRQGERSEVIAAAEDRRDLDDIELDFEGDLLTISWDGWDLGWDREAVLYITVKDIESIEISGVVNLKGANTLQASHLELRTQGSSSMELGVEVSEELEVRCSGSSDASLFGSSSEAEIRTSGSSSLSALELEIRNAEIRTSGASDASLFVTNRTHAKASGASSIEIAGGSEIDSTTSGAADISRISKESEESE